MTESAKLKLSINEAGQGSVSLNGIDIGNLTTAVEFKAKTGELTEIKLTIFAELDAELTAKLEKIALVKEGTEPRKVTTADGRELTPRSRKP